MYSQVENCWPNIFHSLTCSFHSLQSPLHHWKQHALVTSLWPVPVDPNLSLSYLTHQLFEHLLLLKRIFLRGFYDILSWFNQSYSFLLFFSTNPSKQLLSIGASIFASHSSIFSLCTFVLESPVHSCGLTCHLHVDFQLYMFCLDFQAYKMMILLQVILVLWLNL